MALQKDESPFHAPTTTDAATPIMALEPISFASWKFSRDARPEMPPLYSSYAVPGCWWHRHGFVFCQGCNEFLIPPHTLLKSVQSAPICARPVTAYIGMDVSVHKILRQS